MRRWLDQPSHAWRSSRRPSWPCTSVAQGYRDFMHQPCQGHSDRTWAAPLGQGSGQADTGVAPARRYLPNGLKRWWRERKDVAIRQHSVPLALRCHPAAYPSFARLRWRAAEDGAGIAPGSASRALPVHLAGEGLMQSFGSGLRGPAHVCHNAPLVRHC